MCVCVCMCGGFYNMSVMVSNECGCCVFIWFMLYTVASRRGRLCVISITLSRSTTYEHAFELGLLWCLRVKTFVVPPFHFAFAFPKKTSLLWFLCVDTLSLSSTPAQFVALPLPQHTCCSARTSSSSSGEGGRGSSAHTRQWWWC